MTSSHLLDQSPVQNPFGRGRRSPGGERQRTLLHGTAGADAEESPATEEDGTGHAQHRLCCLQGTPERGSAIMARLTSLVGIFWPAIEVHLSFCLPVPNQVFSLLP